MEERASRGTFATEPHTRKKADKQRYVSCGTVNSQRSRAERVVAGGTAGTERRGERSEKPRARKKGRPLVR